MPSITMHELRNRTDHVLERVHAGETMVIMVDGQPTAELGPLNTRPRFIDRAAFVRQILPHQADPGIAAAVADLAPDTSDDLPD